MDTLWNINNWQQTRPAEPGEIDLRPRLQTLRDLLSHFTQELYHHPYDADCWLRRGEVLAMLRYPELAVGDTYKALLLTRQALAGFEDRRMRLGYRMGFWMLEESSTGEDDWRDTLEQRLADIQSQAHIVETQNLYHFPTFEEGRYLQRPYPWMQRRHCFRDDSLLSAINEEFAAQARSHGDGKACCVLQRHAFGKSSDRGRDSSEVLGVFAGCDMLADTTLVVDKTEIWGCIGAGRNNNRDNLHGGLGCPDPIHPNLPSDAVEEDLRWIRERAGSSAGEVILRCRFLMRCIADGVAHPLDHTFIARLTPTYRRERPRLFSLEHDIVIPNDCLQRCGIDIFADSRYDTWVMFTIGAREVNNSWSDPVHNCISPLFSLFNHSCEANVEWIAGEDYTTLTMATLRDIKQGEQLFVLYDSYLGEQPLRARRRRMRKWLDAECQCDRCLREEAEAKQTIDKLSGTDSPSGIMVDGDGAGQWDTAPKPVFPEDALNGKLHRLDSGSVVDG
ncbi:hypothetical protein BAUCODRAFT_145845 [Baudoinia panamericana UAMH 10762]|uniref:SET domain-containing protein n=1 Tax=Baudoinia panamericana (strain UAMH 10762) TaxID=717646 RepID=M2NIA7_BAUPA|nr:uncharacterized protein BAUCODRAFT_145845 [Baudoinia panamericana UAMH 10762]EMC98825.1 hypothetical protein BAUCODRAFT_145845 [Baudoinia panamericana UAMH 10762]